MNPDNITQYLNRMGDRLQKEIRISHLNPHAFRHAVASILVANGTDIVTTAAFIGDKPATVSERYAHIIDSAKIRAGDTLSSVIFEMVTNELPLCYHFSFLRPAKEKER